LNEAPVCEKCGSPLKQIFYGYPTRKVLEDPNVIIGGCTMFGDDPEFGCDCEKQSPGIAEER
jgi:hypothetical protein